MSFQETRIFSPVPQAQILELGNPIFEGLKNLCTRAIGCWHLRLSRPFTHGRESYRTCLHCGMRREFDLQRWKSIGRFYSSPIDRS